MVSCNHCNGTGEVVRRKINWQRVRILGRLPDKEVAKRVGRSCSAVKRARWRLGIPSSSQRGAKQHIEETILGAISLRDVVPFGIIKAHVRADWGTVSDRTVYRELRRLLKEGRIERQHKLQSPEGGYVLAEAPDAYEDVECRCGHGAMWHADGAGYCEKCGCLHLVETCK